MSKLNNGMIPAPPLTHFEGRVAELGLLQKSSPKDHLRHLQVSVSDTMSPAEEKVNPPKTEKKPKKAKASAASENAYPLEVLTISRVSFGD